ncbi:MAG: acyl-phosphate glycerol 3-phosphate acyltransferase [Parachlamydia sp.]|nr:MAG: acyl-phosphate glycerol 3-phosphate acyltransferase [Parachlamydia sp.]
MIELHALFKGRVQGVGFRYIVKTLAQQLGLKGTVKNLPDGSVEIFAQGKQEDLELFLLKLKEEPGLGRIESVQAEYQVPNSAYDSFKTIY